MLSKNTFNLLLYFSGIAISGLLSFIFIPTVIKMYDIESYGRYSMIFNLLCIIAMVCYAWLGQSFVRLYSNNYLGLFSISLSLLTKSLVIGSFAFLIFTFLLGLKFSEIFGYLPSFFLFGYYCFFLLVSQAKQKAKLVMFCEVLRTLVSIASLFIFYKIFGSANANYALMLSLFFSYLIPICIIYKRIAESTIELDTEEIIKIKGLIYSYGIPVGIFLSTSMALSVNDRYIISYIMGKQEAGVYSAIYDVFNKGITALLSPFLMTFYPVIATLYNNGDKVGALRKIKSVIFFELLIVSIGFIVLLIFTPLILKIIFNRDMPASLNFVCYMVYFGVCFWQVSMVVHKPLELLKKTGLMAKLVLVCFFINVILNIGGLKLRRDLQVPALTTIVASLLYLILVLIISIKKWQRH